MSKLTLCRNVFVDCQGGMHSHGRLINSLTELYNKTPLDDFWEDFVHHLKYSLIIFKREPAVERTIDFVSKFATSLCKKPQKEQNLEEEQDEDDEDIHPFLLKLFSFLLKHHNACDKAVRFRCCQLVNKLLVSLGEDAQIDDDLYDKIYECMLQRLRDKFPAVRVQSVLALTRLQDPQDRDCPIINAYLFLLGSDTNPDVRRAVLSCIAATTKTLPAILERTRDTKELVRKLAFQIISEKINVRALTIAQRVSLLQQGLNDRVDSVKETCLSRLVQSWLRNYQGNILDLLKCLDIENALETTDQMLAALFQKTPVTELIENFDLLNQELTLPIEELTCESSMYWRSLCSHVKSLGVEAEEQLDRLLPTGKVLAKYLLTVAEHMSAETNLDAQLRNEFILQQLLSLATQLDFSDEMGRREMDTAMKVLLQKDYVSHTQVKAIIDVITLIQTDPDTIVQNLVEIISDIREPINVVEIEKNKDAQRQRDVKLAGIRVKLNQVREELDDAIKQQDFEKAAELKTKVTELDSSKQSILEESDIPESQEVRVEKNDPITLLKCLTIASEMLAEVDVRGLTPTLQTLLEVLIIPGIQNAEPAVRNAALRALGLCCLLDKETAKAHLLLYMQVAQIDQEGIKVTAMKVIFDLLLTFGLEAFDVEGVDEDSTTENMDQSGPFNDSDDDQTEDVLDNTNAEPKETEKSKPNTAGSIMMILTSLLDSESSEVRTVTAEGLAKLLLSGRILSPKIMSRLLLLWYNPIMKDEGNMCHCLGAFFPIFAFAGRANQQVLEEAFLPTLTTLFNAPATSPLAKVNVSNVSELLSHLTNSAHLINTTKTQPGDILEVTPHDNLAVKISNEILSDPNSFNVRLLCQTLNLLQVSPGNVTMLKDLCVLSEQMLKEVKDKQCTKLLEKFHRIISEMYIAACPAVSEESNAEEDSDKTLTAGKDGDMTANSTVLKEIDNTRMEEDPELLPDNEGDITGIRRLVSKRGKSTKTPVSQAKKPRAKKSTAAAKDSEMTSESDNAENSIFGSPTPVRKSTRSTRTQSTAGSTQKPAKKQGKKGGSTSLRNTKKKLQEFLTDSESQHSDTESIKGAKSRTTRNQGRTRSPLSDIENEAK